MFKTKHFIALAIGCACLLACSPKHDVDEQNGSDFTEQETESADGYITTKQKNTQALDSELTAGDSGVNQAEPAISIDDFRTLEWIDLMPKDDLDALLNPPEYLNDVQDGSFEDQVTSQIQNSMVAAHDDRYQQALTSTRVITEMNNQAIKIPGFIVPLEFNQDQSVTQFFLVPFFGACIHQPPPPPNQIIFVNYPQGLALNSLYDPFWISGLLRTSLVEHEMAVAAYSLQMTSFEPYKEPGQN